MGKWSFALIWWVWGSFEQNFAPEIHKVLQGDLHKISTLTINTLLDFFDLVAEDEVELEILFYFFNAVHDGGVVLDADFGCDFIGTEAEFLREDKHSDLAGVLDVGDTGFTAHFLSSEVVVFSDFVDNLFGGDGAEFRGFIDGNGAILDEF